MVNQIYGVEVVIVGGDIALPDLPQPRGVAGTLLVHKIAGALAQSGADHTKSLLKANAGRGVAMSHVMGRILAERVLGCEAKDLPFPATAIKAYPMHRFHALGARTVVWWMKRQDMREVNAG